MPKCSDPLNAKILIVDDQESNVRLLEFALRRAGFAAVSFTTDSTEVCELHRLNGYALILLDLRMPRMDGFAVMAGLAGVTGHDHPAVLILSADPAQTVRALEAGANSFLSKPFVLTELLLRVKMLLSVPDAGVQAA